ncbi:discoidin domain-containing protein [Paraflavitalea soli]|nr:discoidin domain-containing protein [Paraflavitalea soli]
MKRPSFVTGFLLSLYSLAIAQAPAQNKSSWVYPGKNGKLVYKTTPSGDRIMDFSQAGYRGGGVALPTVPVKRMVKPSGKDDTELIQAAINEVSNMPLVNGFRGAVQLAPGTFTCSGALYLSASGVVLRGSGSGKGGTTIRMTGPKHTAIVIGKKTFASDPNDEPAAPDEPFTAAQTTITAPYTPAGTYTLVVADSKAFAAGDKITIKKPVTDAWVHFMGMDNMKRDGKPQTWIAKSRSLVMQRKITAIKGNQLTIDIPLADALDNRFFSTPGLTVSKLRAAPAVTDVGVEQLHIQCPPLESSYGNAPYAGVRIGGNDCWIRQVYFEETMNTTVFAGNRNTIEQVKITHTYPNLGASKPADFSFEGSENLLNKCEATGGNTYFVWTSSLVPGPNVMLNCTFRGHGSRIQLHQRWATGLLVDNCTMIDGGIDFMNRGVAGSGHGWTMGWAVAWNSIAKTYIIQQPPGAANWAIGCIGSREQTARLFDSSPILDEGYFESHGKPVFPQSLYLAQLADRLGQRAIANLGYASNTISQFPNKRVQPTPPLKTAPDPVLGADLALHRPINSNQMRHNLRQFAGEKAVDADPATYWATNDSSQRATLEIDMEGPVVINALLLSEAAGMGQVLEYKVEGQVDSDWLLLSQGTTIGNRKVDQFPAVTVWKVRLTILKVNNYAAIRQVGLYNRK